MFYFCFIIIIIIMQIKYFIDLFLIKKKILSVTLKHARTHKTLIYQHETFWILLNLRLKWWGFLCCFRSMLNCVNALEQHLPGMEQAGLVVAEEKAQQDSCKILYVNSSNRYLNANVTKTSVENYFWL